MVGSSHRNLLQSISKLSPNCSIHSNVSSPIYPLEKHSKVHRSAHWIYSVRTKEQRDGRLQRRPVQSLSFTLGRLCKQTKGFGYLQAYLYAKAVQMFRVSRVHTLRHESFSYDRKRDRRKQLKAESFC